MPTYLDPRLILHRHFPLPDVLPHHEVTPAQEYYWHDYTTRLFASNGLRWQEQLVNPQQYAKVVSNLTSFINMIGNLLPEYQAGNDTAHIDSVLMAHWTPDVHLGSSVVNYVIESLKLPACLALTISDRGPDAALFAFSSIANCQQDDDHDALLLIADQRHLLYRSALMTSLDPQSNACLFSVSGHEQPLRYQGFCRQAQPDTASLTPAVQRLSHHFSLRTHRLCVIAEPLLLAGLPASITPIATNPRLVCAAPFVALAEHYQPGQDYLLLVQHQQHLSALALRGLA
ncbi:MULTISPECIES: hypothetical protein [Dickeya]|uniref:Uncharacterized protein n=1 Tax=Dickeya aquatica TaxID=1401087 RepID=A0A375AGP0_9GAMM|nr:MULTISPECIES: hypothetical protein [Dickeya]SLM65076.1 FIG00613118: hypothetical protein [Dickeya aquatica]